MKTGWTWRTAALLLILAPGSASAQFEAVRFSELPPIGSWAEYQVTTIIGSTRTVTSRRVALLSLQEIEGQEYYWFQVESQSDDFGSQRVDLVTQFAISKAQAESGKDLFRSIREMIVQVGTAPAARLSNYMSVGIQKSLVSGGEGGAGSDIDYVYRDLGTVELDTRLGQFAAKHHKGLGKAEVIISYEDPRRFEVDSISELWVAADVPFGMLRQVTKMTGQGPQSADMSIAIDSEEIVQLVAFGVGAKSEIRGQVFEFDPAQAAAFRPRF